jgi:AraC-like DNA-binding protein
MESGAHFQLVPQTLFLAHALGRSPEPLIRRFDLPERADEQESIWMPVSTLRAFLDAAASYLQVPQLGLTLAENVPRGGYGVLEHSARSALTLGEAAAVFTRYMGLPGDTVSLALEQGRTAVRFVHRVEGQRAGLGPHGNVFALAYTLRMARELTGRRLPVGTLTLADSAQPDVPALKAWFDTREVELDAGYNAMEVDAALLKLPVISADARVHRSLIKILDQLHASPNREGGFGTRLELAVRAAIEERGSLAIERIARQVGMSSRTLQRRLAASGGSYQELIEGVRRRVAEKLLANPAISIAEVSYRLGYADVRSFARAFRRWKGAPPGAYRRRPP